MGAFPSDPSSPRAAAVPAHRSPLVARRSARLALVLATLLCLTRSARHAGSLAVAAWPGYQRIHGSTFEQLRLSQYGDCDRRGYGFVTRMLDGFPDPEIMPRMRYPDYDRHVDFVLPHERPRRDDRLLIGV